MWAQWQIAYSCGIRSQSEETALHIIGSLMDSSQHVLFVKDIIHWCCESFKDQSLPKMSQCANRKQPEYDCLLYAKLMSMTRSASNAEKALKTLVKKFGKVNFNEDDEQIFPLLHLFCDTVMSAPFVHQERYFDAYRALQPVYLWPLPHCDVARDVMNFIQDEMRSPGINYRRNVISEHNLDLKCYLASGTREQNIHILVDMSVAEANTILSALAHHDTLDETSLKKLIIKHAFVSFYGTNCNVKELESCLSACAANGLIEQLCMDVVCFSEEAADYTSGEKARELLTERFGSVIERLMAYRNGSDKAILATDGDDENENDMVATPLPKPAMECHKFNSETLASSNSALFDILFKSEYDPRPFQLEEPFLDRNNSAGGVTSFGDRNNSTGSRTSIDSLGSNSTGCSPPASLLPDIMEESEGFDDVDTGEQMTDDLPMSFLGIPDTRTSSFGGTSLDSTGSSELDVQAENTKGVHSLPLALQLSADRNEDVPDILVVTPSGKTVTQPFVPVSLETSESPANEKCELDRHNYNFVDVKDQQIMQGRVNRSYSMPEVQLRATHAHQISPDQASHRGIFSLYPPRKFEMRTAKSRLHRSRRWGMNKTERNKPTLFKIVVISQDQGLNAIAGAYADIRSTHSTFFDKTEVQFYYLPLGGSKAVELGNGSANISKKASKSNGSSSHSTDKNVASGKIKNWLADFLGKIDGWYYHYVTAALKTELNILPQQKQETKEAKPGDILEKRDSESERNITPSELIQNTIVNMCRFSKYQLGIKLYCIKVWSDSVDPRAQPSCRLVMVQRLIILGAGQLRYPNEFSETHNQLSVLQVTGSLMTVDGQRQGPFMLPDKSYWSVTLSNLPLPGDTCIANPETAGLELSLVEGMHLPLRIGFKGRRYGPKEKEVLHVSEVQVSSQKPFVVILDNGEPMTVMRVQVKPCLSPVVSSEKPRPKTVALTGSNPDDFVYLSQQVNDWSNQAGSQEQIEFPLMTFWPAALRLRDLSSNFSGNSRV